MNQSLNKGFTIVEVMIYVSLLTVTMVVLAQFTTDIIRNTARSRVVKEVELNAQLTMNRMASEIRHAQSITSVSATEVVYLDANSVSTILRFDSANSRVERVINSIAESITTPEVRVTALNFTSIESAGIIKGIDLAISVSQKSISAPADYKHQANLATKVFARQKLY